MKYISGRLTLGSHCSMVRIGSRVEGNTLTMSTTAENGVGMKLELEAEDLKDLFEED